MFVSRRGAGRRLPRVYSQAHRRRLLWRPFGFQLNDHTHDDPSKVADRRLGYLTSNEARAARQYLAKIEHAQKSK
jgi:hypothetical protein